MSGRLPAWANQSASDLAAAIGQAGERRPPGGLPLARALITAEARAQEGLDARVSLRQRASIEGRQRDGRIAGARVVLLDTLRAAFTVDHAERLGETLEIAARKGDPNAAVAAILQSPDDHGRVSGKRGLLQARNRERAFKVLSESLPQAVEALRDAWHTPVSREAEDDMMAVGEALNVLARTWDGLLDRRLEISLQGRLLLAYAWVEADDSNDRASCPDTLMAIEARVLPGMETLPLNSKRAAMRVLLASTRMTLAFMDNDPRRVSEALHDLAREGQALYAVDLKGELTLSDAGKPLTRVRSSRGRPSKVERALAAARAGMLNIPAHSEE